MKSMTSESFVKDLLKRGRYSFSRQEAAERLGLKGPVLTLSLQRLKHAGWVAPVSRGFYVALDVQHQAFGMLDPAWFVDAWAEFMRMGYYVGGLSAAALHGAAHHRPMQFQVFTNRQIRNVDQAQLHIAAFYKRNLSDIPVVKMKSPAGFFVISAPEATACDIIAYRRCCPSLDHAATVLVELADKISAAKLASLVAAGFSLSSLQRLGWVLDRINWVEKTEPLHAALERRPLNWVSLESRLPADGAKNKRWRIIENTDVQPDIER